MCGIFGIIRGKKSLLSASQAELAFRKLLQYSETRGSEASGVILCAPDRVEFMKAACPGSKLIRSNEYKILAKQACNLADNSSALIGHSRMVTNGAQELHENNQPIRKNSLVGVHNGIVVNVDELWNEIPEYERECEVDTEVILALIDHHTSTETDLRAATERAMTKIRGMATLAVISQKEGQVVLTTNNGSLYTWQDPETLTFLFASERFILEKALHSSRIAKKRGVISVKHMSPGSTVSVDISSARITTAVSEHYDIAQRPIRDVSGTLKGRPANQSIRPSEFTRIDPDARFEEATKRVAELRRCTRCVLPETIPWINFDDQGICNYCRHYQPITLKGEAALNNDVDRFRRSDGRPDCIVAFSGGRDSSYGLHYIKKVLGLNPIAYTYDWGMVTDLARRNQSRMCGQLGVEHILVSANIARKRQNIRKNVSAWLRAPNLGTIPLFMAGDKQFFFHAHRLAKNNDTPLMIFSENLLEKTHFKSGFCGIRPDFGKDNTYTLKARDKFTLATFYSKAFLKNPGYINSSLIDTLGAFASYYVLPHRICWLFQYIPWIESEVEQTLLGEYDWETAKDTKSTWRIGDGTASFYNYIYYMMAGFTENDTFRSNQIREGTLDRETALQLTIENNQPRWESIAWYCETIGLEYRQTLDTINDAPRLY